MKAGSRLFRLEAAVAALEAQLLPRLQRWADEPHFKAIRDAIVPTFWVLVAVTLVAYFLLPPAPPPQKFLDAYRVGFGGMGVALAALLADRLAQVFGFSRWVAIVVCLACFVLSLPHPIPKSPIDELARISSTSLFLALIIDLSAGEIFRWSARFIANRALALTAAAVGIIGIFGGIAAALAPGHHGIADILLVIVKPLVGIGDTLPALLIVVFLQTLLWSAGVHGPAFLAAVTTPIFLGAIDANAQAFRLGQSPPYIVTWMTFNTFVYPGGSGATLPLAIMMLRSRIARLRRLAYASFVPSAMNINEPLIFGVPIVMNPSLVIPFIGVPLLLATVTYLSTYFGLVDRTVYLSFTVFPAPINAFISTNGDWRAVALVGANIAIGFVLYLPFLRSFEESIEAAPGAEEELVKTAEALREHKLDLEHHPAPTSHQP